MTSSGRLENTKPGFTVLYEDNHLLVVSKPAQLPTMGAAADEDSLVVRAKAYLKARYNKPGKVYLGVVSRLDAWVTGALVLARTSKAAARLNKQFAAGTVDKRYWAIVPSSPVPVSGQLEDWIRKDDARRRMVVCGSDHSQGKQARLRYRTVGEFSAGTLLEVELLTGRKHQIRLQLAERGLPILGDRKYGSDRSFPEGIALHSRQLSFAHPVGQEPLAFTAALPSYWPAID